MQNLVQNNNGQPVTNSLLVAEKFGKRHADVIRAIESLISQTPENQRQRNFAFMLNIKPLPNGGKKEEPMYILTKDGFSAVALGFTGKKAIEFRWDFIEAFNKMEQIIRNGLEMRIASVEENIKRRYLLNKERKQVNAQIKVLLKRHGEIERELTSIDENDFGQLSLFPRFEMAAIRNPFPNKSVSSIANL